MIRTMIERDYSCFLNSLKEYELAYLSYIREKERRKKHWVRT